MAGPRPDHSTDPDGTRPGQDSPPAGRDASARPGGASPVALPGPPCWACRSEPVDEPGDFCEACYDALHADLARRLLALGW